MSDYNDDIWGLSDGGSAADTGTEYETPGGGNLEPLPEGSKVLAMVENAEWRDADGSEVLSLEWTIIKPADVANRRVFQKLWITDTDLRVKDAEKAAKKRDRARRMFAAIDANAGGKLSKKGGGKPDADAIMLALANKAMVIRLGLWEMPDRDDPNRTMSGNWVQAVAPKTAEIGLREAKALPASRAPAPSTYGGLMDDDVRF